MVSMTGNSGVDAAGEPVVAKTNSAGMSSLRSISCLQPSDAFLKRRMRGEEPQEPAVVT